MRYITFSQKYQKQLIELWNKEIYFDKIDEAAFENKYLFDVNFDSDLTSLAIDDNDKLVGFLLAIKRKYEYFDKGLEPNKAWIIAIAVDSNYQKQSIGQTMYDIIEKKLVDKGVKEIVLAAYSPNYFYYGIDKQHYPVATSFFLKNGFVDLQTHYSMMKDLHGFTYDQKTLDRISALNKEGYKFVGFDYSKSLELINLIEKEFSTSWLDNVLKILKERRGQELINLVLNPDDQICGFSLRAIDGNLNRFGPIGIEEAYRNKGLGTAFLQYCMYDMSVKGIYHMFFMTTDELGKNYYIRNGLSVLRTVNSFSKYLNNE